MSNQGHRMIKSIKQTWTLLSSLERATPHHINHYKNVYTNGREAQKIEKTKKHTMDTRTVPTGLRRIQSIRRTYFKNIQEHFGHAYYTRASNHKPVVIRL
ncbi:hypothetical protein BX666DRAFT_1928524, partial [Dichotomocladium elegans]